MPTCVSAARQRHRNYTVSLSPKYENKLQGLKEIDYLPIKGLVIENAWLAEDRGGDVCKGEGDPVPGDMPR